jgi:Domain of unknown function (DUF4352)
MRGAPTWAIVLLLLVIVGLGIYAYFTTPLPFGLSSVIRTPGGANVQPAQSTPVAAPGARTAAGQPLVLGATNVVILTVQRNQTLVSTDGTPRGSFTMLLIELQNSGNEPLSPQPSNFRLIDDRGRNYAIDVEATRSANASGGRRYLFEASVPPGGRFPTLLAFETPADVAGLTLRVTLGYGELEVPR